MEQQKTLKLESIQKRELCHSELHERLGVCNRVVLNLFQDLSRVGQRTWRSLNRCRNEFGTTRTVFEMSSRQVKANSFLLILFVWAFCSTNALAQHSTVYTSVLATKVFVVGAANAETGLFYQTSSEDTTWGHTGPGNIRAFGVAVYAPSRGQVICIASGNGVHRTTDGGKSWKITTGWQVTEVLWVTIDQKNPENIFCATPYGVFRTKDGGVKWEEKNHGLNAKFTSSIIIDHTDSKILYCSTEDGVYRSDDGAGTWMRTGLSVGGIRIVVQHPKDPSVLFAGTEDDGIYRTRNGGKWWEKCEAGLDQSTFYTIAFDPNNPQTMYAGGYITGVYKSTDGGDSWRRVNEGLSTLNVHSIAVDPTNGNRIYAATLWGGVYRSDDAGASWHHAGLSGSEVWRIIVEPF
jgi:photosystem II stability/assembly factor-like uncharacterized protein